MLDPKLLVSRPVGMNVMNPRLTFTCAIIGLSIFLVLNGCGDDTGSPNNDPGDPLLTFEIGDYFVTMFGEEGLVFASDRDGELLGVTSWSGASTVELYGEGARPDTVSYTFVRGEASRLALSTEVGVPTGTVVSFDGGYAFNPTAKQSWS